MQKTYTQPAFELVNQNESVQVFFAVSPVATINSMTQAVGSWE